MGWPDESLPFDGCIWLPNYRGSGLFRTESARGEIAFGGQDLGAVAFCGDRKLGRWGNISNCTLIAKADLSGKGVLV